MDAPTRDFVLSRTENYGTSLLKTRGTTDALRLSSPRPPRTSGNPPDGAMLAMTTRPILRLHLAAGCHDSGVRSRFVDRLPASCVPGLSDQEPFRALAIE